jgi:hypothetical protein
MKNKFLFLAVLAFSFCTVFTSMAQDKVYLAYFEAINMNKDYQYSSAKLLKSYMEDTKRYKVILPSAEPDGKAEEEETAKANAARIGTKYYVLGSLNRLGEVVIVNIHMYETANGNLVWSDKLKAKNPEDLDPIFQKVANHIGTVNKAATDDDIYNVTQYDSKELNKIQATSYFGASLGGMVLFNNWADEPIPGLGVLWSYDTRKLLLEIKGNWFFSKPVDVYNFSLEVYKPLSNKSLTPFIGGGLAVGGTTVTYENNDGLYPYYFSDRESKGGLMAIAGGGLIFNRNSNAEVRASGNIIHGFYSIDGKYTTGAMLKMEILFSK